MRHCVVIYHHNNNIFQLVKQNIFLQRVISRYIISLFKLQRWLIFQRHSIVFAKKCGQKIGGGGYPLALYGRINDILVVLYQNNPNEETASQSVN